jgi:hypothetical protein
VERKFKKDVSESLKLLHSVLLKKAETQNLSKEQSQKCIEYLNFLRFVASNTGACCNPEYFVRNVQKMGFDVQTNFNLFNVDEVAAQCVYDIMICRRDYIYWGDEKLHKTEKFVDYKYKSQQEAIDAMRLFKRDVIQMVGGMIPYFVRNLLGKNR